MIKIPNTIPIRRIAIVGEVNSGTTTYPVATPLRVKSGV